MFSIVHDVKAFCKMELLGSIYASQIDIKTLMEESAGEAERREALLKMYHGLKVSFMFFFLLFFFGNKYVNENFKKFDFFFI